MNLKKVLCFLDGYQLDDDKRRFITLLFTCHDVLDRVLERFNQSEFAYKKGQKALYLKQAKGLASFHAEQDRTFNRALLNTLAGGLDLVRQLEASCTKTITAELDALLLSRTEFFEFREDLLNEFHRLALADDGIAIADAVMSSNALAFQLDLGHRGGIKALLAEFRTSLGQFAALRKKPAAGRRFPAAADASVAEPLTGRDRLPRDYDLVHIWGFRWVTVFKVIVRIVCYVIIICFVWEEEELVKELKKIWRCKWIDPRDFPPDMIPIEEINLT